MGGIIPSDFLIGFSKWGFSEFAIAIKVVIIHILARLFRVHKTKIPPQNIPPLLFNASNNMVKLGICEKNSPTNEKIVWTGPV